MNESDPGPQRPGNPLQRGLDKLQARAARVAKRLADVNSYAWPIRLLVSGEGIAFILLVIALFVFGYDPSAFPEPVRPVLPWITGVAWLVVAARLAFALWRRYFTVSLVRLATAALTVLALGWVLVVPVAALTGLAHEPVSPTAKVALPPDKIVDVRAKAGEGVIVTILERHDAGKAGVTYVSSRYEGTLARADGTYTLTVKRGEKDVDVQALVVSLAYADKIYVLEK